MIDIQGIANNTLARMHETGEIEKMVEEKLKKTIQDSVESAIGRWSGFGKELEEAIKKKIHVDPEAVNLQAYNEVIAKVLERQMNSHLTEQGVAVFERMIAEITKTAQKHYKLSEVIKLMLKDHNDDAANHKWEHPTIIIQTEGRFTHIYLDPAPKKRKHDCQYQMALMHPEKEGEFAAPYSVKSRDWLRGDRFNRADAPLFNRPVMSGVERVLFDFYVQVSTLEVDVDDCDSTDFDFEYDKSEWCHC